MDALQAANQIRRHVNFDHAQTISADDRHQVNFVTDVCKHLGLEPNVVWFSHVQDVLARHGHVHKPDEYPKMATNADGQPLLDETTKEPIVYHSADEEAAAHAATKRKKKE